ncbi:ficolin-3-like [Argopecten irradians]|uniref:ficolin-3-like n=1 Tax=Argopecten irradians TaxID=31199 RepID=UPI00370FF842
MDTVDGGWTVIQHRFDGSQDFYRMWKEYKRGFGSPYGEYWIGNENLYLLTSSGSYELRIEMGDVSGLSKHFSYSNFSVASENENYTLTISGFSGHVHFDSMAVHNLNQFSTADRDNDATSAWNCAEDYSGGWWYDNCLLVNLNGRYDPTATDDAKAMYCGTDYDILAASQLFQRAIITETSLCYYAAGIDDAYELSYTPPPLTTKQPRDIPVKYGRMDAFRVLNFYQFSTADKDNEVSDANCAVIYHGGWWYSSCHVGNFNGRYDPTAFNDPSAMCWVSFNIGQYSVLKYSEMMIRPI